MKICEDDNSTYKTERPLQNNKILVALLSEHNLIKDIDKFLSIQELFLLILKYAIYLLSLIIKEINWI